MLLILEFGILEFVLHLSFIGKAFLNFTKIVRVFRFLVSETVNVIMNLIVIMIMIVNMIMIMITVMIPSTMIIFIAKVITFHSN